MFRSLHNNEKGIMDLLLSTTGLFLVGGMILLIIFGMISQNNWKEQSELKQLTTSITMQMQAVDTAWYEKQERYQVPQSHQSCQLTFSTEYIHITKTQKQKKIQYAQPLLLPLWIRTNSDPWMTADQLHLFLDENFSSKGTKQDPLQISEKVRTYLTSEWNRIHTTYLLDPYIIDTSAPLIFEKTYLYFDTNNDGVWDPDESIKELFLFYQ